MAFNLGPINCPDEYDGTTKIPARTVTPCVRINMWVSSAPVFYRVYNEDLESLDRYVPAGTGLTTFASFERQCTGIEFRNAVAGQVATVYCELLTESDLPDQTT